jgi:hypothetical protein
LFQHIFSLLRLGKGGPIIRQNGTTVVEIRNAANTDYETLRADSPTGNDDVATKKYTDDAIDTDVTAALTDLTALDGADPTKEAFLELDGLTTATTRTLTVQDKDITIAGTADITTALTDCTIMDGADSTKEAFFELDGLTTSTTRTLTVQDKDITIADDADLVTMCPGVPMQNRLRLLGAPGAAAAGDTVTIGADVYEFRGDTPPSSGTAGRIWVYNGVDSAASRANLINAINGVVDAPTITRDGTNTETVVAAAGVTTGDIVVQSADGIGGTPTPSSTATACSEGLTTVTDIWDAATMYNGLAQQARQSMAVAITLTADIIAKGDVQVYFDFTPRSCMVVNRMRPQDEAYEITGNAVSLTLAGGGAPNNQVADIIDIIAFA